MFSSVWQNSFGRINFLPNAVTRRHFDQQRENTYSSELWLLDLLLLYCLRHLFCLVIVDIFSPSHQAYIIIRVCLFILSTCVCVVSLQAPFLNGGSALRNIFLLKSSNGTFGHFGKAVLNLLKALIFPFLTAYFPTLYLSFFQHLWYWGCLFADFADGTWFFMSCTSNVPISEAVGSCSVSIIMERTSSIKGF